MLCFAHNEKSDTNFQMHTNLDVLSKLKTAKTKHLTLLSLSPVGPISQWATSETHLVQLSHISSGRW